ncbi:MAG: thioredoxin [Nitrospinota bacterium]|nr:MAG: thioredoxin [Nitrospinota bacterium]
MVSITKLPQKRHLPWWGGLLLLGLSLLTLPVQAQPSSPASPVVATVNGHTITEEELRASIQGELYKLETQIYTLKKEGIETLIGNYLLEQEATRRGISVKELIKKEIDDQVAPVTETEAQQFYNANKSRINRPLEQIKPQLIRYLQNRKREERRKAFLASLRKGASITVNLQPPRIEVSIDDDPIKGDPKAPITIVEFSDFQCPFCKRVLPTLRQVLSTYQGKVRLVYRDFPLRSIHPYAQQGAEAANCAREQGKFWEYHDAIFGDQEQLTPDKLSTYAQNLGLDMTAFKQCLSSRKYRDEVQKDIDDGERVGVSGTPAFFINGRLLSGAQPFSAFQEIIEEELQLLAQQKSGR